MHVIQEPLLEFRALSEAERNKIREQLNRLLESHHFKNSRRYPALLRFIVEEALDGRGEFLKERLLGVRVFDRPADYDTATDPVVRVTIAEIRKRIAQYYHDEEHDAEMRIELLPGRYAPEFRVRSTRREPLAEAHTSSELEAFTTLAAQEALPIPPVAPEPLSTAPARGIRAIPWFRVLAGVFTGVIILLGCVFGVRWLRPSALDTLWAPMLNSQHALLFCVPTDVGRKRGPAGDSTVIDLPASRLPGNAGITFLDHESLGENVVYSDMLATLSIASVLAVHGQDFRVRLNVSTTLEDLRQGPTVLVGGLDNQWTMRALGGLRFHFAGSDEDRYWIADTQNPGQRAWSLDLKQQYNTVTRDYAIIARLHNEQTGQPEVVVAGIGMSGTAAAGEFLSNERRVEELRQHIGKGFKDHDFEAVLSTDVVNGIAGSPKILAVSVW